MACVEDERSSQRQLAITPNGGHSLPTFENYLKMARFNVTESELLERCVIPSAEQKRTAQSSMFTQRRNSISLDDFMELDEERLFQVLEGDSDFSETISDFSSISISRPKRKKKRSERWRHISRASSDKPMSNGRLSPGTPIDNRRVPSHEPINHKTVIMQHESLGSRKDEEPRRSRSRSRSSGRASNTSAPHSKTKSHNMSIYSEEELPSPNSHKEHRSTNSVRSAKSWSSLIERDSSHSSVAEESGKQNSNSRHKRHRSKHTKGRSRSPSEKEVNSSDKRKCRRHKVKQVAENVLCVEGLEEQSLGRNMRAVARRDSRKLRT